MSMDKTIHGVNNQALRNNIFENAKLKVKVQKLEKKLQKEKKINRNIKASVRYRLGKTILSFIKEPIIILKIIYKKIRLYTNKQDKRKLTRKEDTNSLSTQPTLLIPLEDSVERTEMIYKKLSQEIQNLQTFLIIDKKSKSLLKKIDKRLIEQKILRPLLIDEAGQIIKPSRPSKIVTRYWKSLKPKQSFFIKLFSSQFNPFNYKSLDKKLNFQTQEKQKMVAKFTISVIIPTYKRNPWIAESINSILTQSLSQEDIELIIVVNGKNYEYFNWLQEKYTNVNNIKVFYTPKQGAAAARNLGIRKAKMKYTTFLDDDDYFTTRFLEDLCHYIKSNVDIVCGKFLDFDEGKYNSDNYINNTIHRSKEIYYNDVLTIKSLFATVCGKIYKTSLLKDNFEPFDNSLPNTEDVVFWAWNFDRIDGLIAVVKSDSKEAYVRRIHEGTRSRPQKKNQFKFLINDRLKVINEVSTRMFDSHLSMEQKYFLLNIIKTQNNVLKEGFNSLTEKQKDNAQRIILKENNFFLQDHFLNTATGIAFCFNFSPAADPSAYVATKRLRQFNEILNSKVSWDVISSDLSNCRSTDIEFKNFYTDFVVGNSFVFPGPSYFNEKSQEIFAQKASELAIPISYNYIYSRSMAAGSHIAAYKYKLIHPESKWYAEFSDPLFIDSHNQKRPLVKQYEGDESYLNNYWQYVERIVYEHADIIFFTNEKQREFMLKYNNDKETKKLVLKKSVILSHPILESKFINIHNSKYELDDAKINIGYFGSFYPNRDHSGMLNLLKNDRVVLHLFVQKPNKLKDLQSKPQININRFVSHLEFLNIASKMDYLFLNDMDFEGEINPYQPSKLSDYIASGTKIIAKINNNSALADFHHENIIKLKEISNKFINSL